MSRNRIAIAATPEEVFRVLADPASYPSWVPGAQAIRAADAAWPSRGASLHHIVTAGGVTAEDATSVLVSSPPNTLVLHARFRPFGTARVTFRLEPRGGMTQVTVQEELLDHPLGPFGAWLEPMLHLRNAELLARLKERVQGEGAPRLMERVRPLRPWLDEDPFKPVLDASAEAYLAVETEKGPHVTPVAFASAGGRLWAIVDRRSVKARTVDGRVRGSALVRAPGQALIVSGMLARLDPVRPVEMAASITEAGLLPLGLWEYGRRHLRRLFRYSVSSPDRVPALAPARRIVLALRPDRAVLVAGDDLVASEGFWPVESARADGRRRPDPVSAGGHGGPVPGSVSVSLDERREVALGWKSGGEVLCLPGVWIPGDGSIVLPGRLVSFLGLSGRSSLCLCADARGGRALEDVTGTTMRGEGRLEVSRDEARVRVRIARASTWRGTEVTTSFRN